MDGREQLFADEAVRQLTFLTLPPRDLTGPQIEQQGAGPGRVVFVSYRQGPMTIGIRLVRQLDGDDYVAIACIVDGAGEDGSDYHGELERGAARTDRQMLRAVAEYARQLRVTTGA